MSAKNTLKSLLEPYRTALNLYLINGGAAHLQPALALGQQAVNNGLLTLDLAAIHENAMRDPRNPAETPTPSGKLRSVKRSRGFFAACHHAMENTPQTIVATHKPRETLKRSQSQCHLLEEKLQKSAKTVADLKVQAHTLKAQMSRLSRGILSAQEDERKRISRELHDVIAQLLTSINLRLAKMNIDVTKDHQSVQKNILSTQRLVEKSVGIVHRFARELRPAALDDLGLIPALRAFVLEVSRETGIQVKMTVFAGVERMKSEKRTVLYRVAQEALNNIREHSNASHVEISIRQHPSFVRMILKDDGRGFDVEKAFTGKQSKRLGLLGMRERVEMVGGTFAMESAVGTGSNLRADIPFAPRKKRSVPL